MDNKIIIKINMFAMQQVIFCPDMYQLITDTAELPETIVNLCDKYNTYDVEFLGNKNYLEKTIKQIKENEIAKYGINKINISVR